MKFNQLNGFAFDKETNTLGAIAGVDFIKQTITILADSDETVVAKLSDTLFLEKIGFIGKNGIINHDVVETVDGKLFEIELLEDGETVQIHLINEKLERIDTGDKFNKSEISVLAPYVTFVGNINLLEPVEDKVVDFNIKVVRTDLFSEDVTYYYACNNISVEEVDLIKVVFVGHQLLEEESYERITVSHEEYLDAVEMGYITEVTPQNLMSYVSNLTYSKRTSQEFAGEIEEEEEVEYAVDEDEDEEQEKDCDCIDCRMARAEENIDEEYCEECGKEVEDCDCW